MNVELVKTVSTTVKYKLQFEKHYSVSVNVICCLKTSKNHMFSFSAAAVLPSGMYSKCACHSHPPDSPCLTTQLESSRPNSVQSLKELSLTSLHEGNKSSLVNKGKYIFFFVKIFLSLSHLSLVQA